ncbi:MAG: Trigger factor [bacterium ADurb.Bin243]|nr:MAG: Trigger factor [bacterium ADurb.Bin243]HOD42127.1 trigger factor [Candidatus Wallbacteria bacterium]
MSQTKSTKVLNVQQLSKDKVLLEIEIAADRVKKAIDGAYREVVSKVNIPGFRRGKAPRSIIEMRFGKEYFYEEAQKELLTPAYIEALNAQNIRPIGSELKDVFIEEGKPLVFKIEIQKEPVFDITGYTGIPLTGGPIAVEEAEIDSKIEDLRNRHAKLEVVTDRAAANGDFVIIDYQGYINEEKSDGIKGSDVMFELGAKKAITGFEEGIVGMQIGEEKDLFLKFPEDYHSKDYAGKEVRFHIKLKEIKLRTLPEANDDLARMLGEFNTLPELREDIRKRLIESKTEHQKGHYREQICNFLLEKNPQVEAPEAMIEKELDRIIKNYEIEFMYRRMNFEHYLQATGQTVDDFRNRHMDDAKRNVKITNILSSIGEHEKVSPTEEELKARIEKLALSVGKTYADILKHVEEHGELVYMREEIVHQKVYDSIIEKAQITIDPNYKCTHDHAHGEEDHDHECGDDECDNPEHHHASTNA